MNSDSYFKIGSTHLVCEDFALSNGSEDLSFAILSDGCSGSNRTDFGSRFLCLAMESVLKQEKTFDSSNADSITRSCIYHAQSLVKSLEKTCNISDDCLDATLGYVVCDDTYLRSFLTGDGAIAARQRNGQKWCALIDYPSGAPPYLSYNLDYERYNHYLEKTDGCEYNINIFESSDNSSVMTQTERINDFGMNQHSFIFPREQYDLVMVISDGIQTFQKPKDDVTSRSFLNVPAEEIISRMLDVKSSKGAFIKRRCKRIIKNCLKDNWRHLDDLSVAAVFDEVE